MQPAILTVTSDNIYFNEQSKFHDVRQSASGLKSQNELVNLGLYRGYNNCFFYVEKSSDTYMLCELALAYKHKEKQWAWKTQTIFASSYGQIVAFQLDLNHTKHTDSFWNKKGELSFDKQVPNQLFIIDSALNLVKLKQRQNQYNVLFKISLQHLQGLSAKLESFSQADSPKISISERSLTIAGTHFIYETGHEVSIELPNAEDKILSTQNVEGTNLQLHQIQKRSQSNSSNEIQVILKELPNSRKCCYIGQKSQRDVLLCCYICQDQLLLKIRTERANDHYWTIMSASGKICRMPDRLSRALRSQDDWTFASSFAIKDGQTQVLLRSCDKIAGFRFSHEGSLMSSSIFSARNEEVNLMADTIQCNYDGEMYQLAVVSREKKKRWVDNEQIYKEKC